MRDERRTPRQKAAAPSLWAETSPACEGHGKAWGEVVVKQQLRFRHQDRAALYSRRTGNRNDSLFPENAALYVIPEITSFCITA